MTGASNPEGAHVTEEMVRAAAFQIARDLGDNPDEYVARRVLEAALLADPAVTEEMKTTREGRDKLRADAAELRRARAIPAERFPGHKSIYCANLEGHLGRFTEALADDVDLLLAALQADPERARLVEENERYEKQNERLTQALTDLAEWVHDRERHSAASDLNKDEERGWNLALSGLDYRVGAALSGQPSPTPEGESDV